MVQRNILKGENPNQYVVISLFDEEPFVHDRKNYKNFFSQEALDEITEWILNSPMDSSIYEDSWWNKEDFVPNQNYSQYKYPYYTICLDDEALHIDTVRECIYLLDLDIIGKVLYDSCVPDLILDYEESVNFSARFDDMPTDISDVLAGLSLSSRFSSGDVSSLRNFLKNLSKALKDDINIPVLTGEGIFNLNLKDYIYHLFN